MRRLALKALLFSLPLLLAAAWLEHGLRSMPNSYLLKQRALAAKVADVEVLVLGASEALQGLDPSQMGAAAFNLANVGQDLYCDRALLEAWLPRLPRLRVVVIPVSYPSLEFSLAASPEAWRASFYRLFMGLPRQVPAPWGDLRDHSALLLYQPLPALRFAWGGFKGDAPSMSAEGFQALAEVDEEELELKINAITGRKRVAYHHSTMRPEQRSKNSAELQAMLAMLASRRIRAVLLRPPVSEAYADACDRQRLAADQIELGLLATAFGVPYRDYFRDKRFALADFND
jgi:hypothetical protein